MLALIHIDKQLLQWEAAENAGGVQWSSFPSESIETI